MKHLVLSAMAMFLFSLTACDDSGSDNNENNNNNNTIECINGADEDNDGLFDCFDPDECDAYLCKNAGETSCNDGIDNDGDGDIDCDDIDCAAPCLSGCNIRTVFWDSPATCSENKICAYVGNKTVRCSDASYFSGGKYYGDCGENHECPRGSLCTDLYYGKPPLCVPLCAPEDPYSDRCPENGICVSPHSIGIGILLKVEGTTDNYWENITFCVKSTDDCNPMNNTGCPEGTSCYLLSMEGDTKCLPTGSNTEDGFSNLSFPPISDFYHVKPNACSPGYRPDVVGNCEKICKDDSDCDRSCFVYAQYGTCE